jgi:hypothetical protein
MSGGNTIDEADDAGCKRCRKLLRRGSPMRRELRRLIDYEMRHPIIGQDLFGTSSATAWIEVVAVEVKEHDTYTAKLFQDWVKRRSIESIVVACLIDRSKCRGSGGDDSVYTLALIGRDQRYECSKRLTSKNDFPIPSDLEVVGQPCKRR